MKPEDRKGSMVKGWLVGGAGVRIWLIIFWGSHGKSLHHPAAPPPHSLSPPLLRSPSLLSPSLSLSFSLVLSLSPHLPCPFLSLVLPPFSRIQNHGMFGANQNQHPSSNSRETEATRDFREQGGTWKPGLLNFQSVLSCKLFLVGARVAIG